MAAKIRLAWGPGYLFGVTVVALVYFAAAKLGIELSVARGVITPVWAPTGISLAVVLLFGWRLWPGVAVGAFLSNATSDVAIGIALGIAVGNTLEALIGYYLLRRVGFETRMERVRDVLALVTLGALVSTAIAATNGVTVLALGGEVQWSGFGSEWLLWWFGDAVGDLLVAPFLLVCLSRRKNPRLERPFEGLALLAFTTAVSSYVFLGGNWQFPYLLFPCLVWATLRFGQLGATTAIVLVGVIATWGTVAGSIAIEGATATQSVQLLQALIAILAVSLYLMAATISERDRARAELAVAHSGLSEAQSIAHVGSWEWDLATERVTWSDEMYRIYGFEPGAFDVTFERAVERVVEEDREAIDAGIRNAFERSDEHNLADLRYRVRWPDGTERALLGKAALRLGPDGRPARMVGTVEDITEVLQIQHELSEAFRRERDAAEKLRELDELKNTFLSAVSHDLRNPLTTMAGLASMVAKHFDKISREDAIRSLQRIEAGADHASRVLANLLDVDRVSRGAVTLTRSEVDVTDLALKAVVALDDGSNRITVSKESVVASVDVALVERIIENLIGNALRHTSKRARIWVNLSEGDDGTVLITVEDSGRGVPNEMKESIFEPFFRGDSQTLAGNGVGLFLVAQFARLHGGRAWVEDRPGGGAAFRVSLPRAAELEHESIA